MNRPVITLTTDFGTSDSYVAQMKGAALAVNPAASLVDVTHEIPPQDIATAASVLDDALSAFPAGSIHVVVVDPGVGSDRVILAVEAVGQRFVCPDNGLLSGILDRAEADRVIEVTNRQYFRKSPSSTFHGRDIMAPVAAHWSLGADASLFGSPLDRPPVRLTITRPAATDGGLRGQVIRVDSFGNAISNITAGDLTVESVTEAQVLVGGARISGIVSTYSDVPAGHPAALVGSSGRLEIAMNCGHAARSLGVKVGAPVDVRWRCDDAE